MDDHASIAVPRGVAIPVVVVPHYGDKSAGSATDGDAEEMGGIAPQRSRIRGGKLDPPPFLSVGGQGHMVEQDLFPRIRLILMVDPKRARNSREADLGDPLDLCFGGILVATAP